MDLWIRSQDKRIILQPVMVEACHRIIRAVTISGAFIFIGQYETDERVMEIIEEIKKVLRPRGIIKFNKQYSKDDIRKLRKRERYKKFNLISNDVERIIMPKTYIYELPEK